MSLQLIQFDGNTVTPTADSVVNDLIFGTYGIFNGCEITFLGVNVIKVASGRLLIKGRQVVVLEEEINVRLSSSESQLGRLYLKMDLSNTENPVTFESEVDTELRELTQESDANYTNGIFEVELCNYEVSETAISNILSTCPIIISATQVLDTLEEIEANEQSGLAAGALALKAVNENLGDNELIYENGSYYIQNGGDKSTKKKLGSQKIALATTSASSFSINVGNYYDGDLAELTAANFIVEIYSTYTSLSIAKGDGGSATDSSTVTLSKSYNATTGILSVYIASISLQVNLDFTPSGAAMQHVIANSTTTTQVIPYLVA